MWLVRRVIALISVLVVLCAGVVMITRLNHSPSRLQALGFDVCEGEPCWRGIKPGTKWAKVQSMFRNVKEHSFDHGQSTFDVRLTDENFVKIGSWGGRVGGFGGYGLPATLGEFVALYGSPSCVQSFREFSLNPNKDPMLVGLIYPTFRVVGRGPDLGETYGSHDYIFRVSPEALIETFGFGPEVGINCRITKGNGRISLWRGFRLEVMK